MMNVDKLSHSDIQIIISTLYDITKSVVKGSILDNEYIEVEQLDDERHYIIVLYDALEKSDSTTDGLIEEIRDICENKLKELIDGEITVIWDK